MRKEQDIFDDLAQLCSSPGYAHALAHLCFRDNMVGYGEEVKAEDVMPLFSWTRLIRTEISTLIGLLIKEEQKSSPGGKQRSSESRSMSMLMP